MATPLSMLPGFCDPELMEQSLSGVFLILMAHGERELREHGLIFESSAWKWSGPISLTKASPITMPDLGRKGICNAANMGEHSGICHMTRLLLRNCRLRYRQATCNFWLSLIISPPTSSILLAIRPLFLSFFKKPLFS